MEATISTRKQKFSIGHRKESKCYFKSYKMVVPSDISGMSNYSKIVVDCRIYDSGGSKITACIWVNPKSLSGSGYAGGYGYHKESAAVADAIRNASIDLSEDISGVGNSAIERAMISIAKMAGFPNAILVVSHP